MTNVTTTIAANRPASLHIIGPHYPVFAQAAVLIRQGYVFHPDRPVEVFNDGSASFFLVLGNADQAAIDLANKSMEHAILLQQSEIEAEVNRRAARLLEDYKRDELKKRIDAQVAVNEAQIAKLRKEADAELAKLK